MGYKVKEVKEYSDFDTIVVMIWKRWPWSKSRELKAVGNGTVWHWYPSGKRCPTSMESWLCDVEQRFIFKQEAKTC